MEAQFIGWLREQLEGQTDLSDDAAIVPLPSSHLAPGASGLILTSDLISEGVDFSLAEHEPKRIGRKAVAVNLSDLAAMAASPIGILISLAMPFSNREQELAQRIYEGILATCQEYAAPLLGGDTNLHEGPLVIAGTALGVSTAPGPLTRSGGQPGDRILVTGALGGSIAGHHLDFTPRLNEAIQLNQNFDLHAGMDISDGLALDLYRLAAASNCGAILDLASVPISAAASELENPLHHALSDGEDFELLLAAQPEVAENMVNNSQLACGITDIGELTAKQGLWQRDAKGIVAKLEPTGWLHE